MDYSKMSDAEIGRRVAAACKLEGGANYNGKTLIVKNGVWTSFDPCNDPADAWPIIAENHIGIAPYPNEAYAWSSRHGMASDLSAEDKNPLRAAMTVFLMLQESEKDAGAAKKCRSSEKVQVMQESANVQGNPA